jgi:6-phosphogluconolactonase (cycloisomerase 2 family)
MVFKILVASYTSSIPTLAFDPEASPPSLTLFSTTEVGNNPTWLTRHPTKKDLVFATIEQSEGKVAVLKVDSEGKTSVINTISSHGADPAHAKALEDQLLIGNVS